MAPIDLKKDIRPAGWKYSCGLCQKDHPLKTCDVFRSLNHDQRFDVVCQFSYCANCLARSHTRANCPTKFSCQICYEKHNSLIHYATLIKDLDNERQSRPQQRQQRHSSSQRSPSSKRNKQKVSPARHVSPQRPQQQPSPDRSSSSKRSHDKQSSKRSPSTKRSHQQSTMRRSVSAHRSQQRPIVARSSSAVRPLASRTSPHDILDDSKFKLTPRPSVPFAWSKVFIPTAQIRISIPGFENMWHICRASLNFNATVSRVAVRLQTELNLETFVYNEARFAKFVIAHRLPHTQWKREIRAILTNDLPKKPYAFPIPDDPTTDFTPDTLADPDPRCNAAIEVELAADLYKALYRNGSLETDLPNVIAHQTALGYTFIGGIGNIW
ncbi:uncharacterized protein [Musca autumnalis]|uniref:uncharacterized protein n=1 Tax=Musca autumnalis TaxID=221902 RepID=UPI003CEE5FEF